MTKKGRQKFWASPQTRRQVSALLCSVLSSTSRSKMPIGFYFCGRPFHNEHRSLDNPSDKTQRPSMTFYLALCFRVAL